MFGVIWAWGLVQVVHKDVGSGCSLSLEEVDLNKRVSSEKEDAEETGQRVSGCTCINVSNGSTSLEATSCLFEGKPKGHFLGVR